MPEKELDSEPRPEPHTFDWRSRSRGKRPTAIA